MNFFNLKTLPDLDTSEPDISQSFAKQSSRTSSEPDSFSRSEAFETTTDDVDMSIERYVDENIKNKTRKGFFESFRKVCIQNYEEKFGDFEEIFLI